MSANGFSKEAALALIEWVKEKYDPLAVLDSKEASELLRIPRKTVEYYSRSGQIPKIQMGRHIRFSPLALCYWMIERHAQRYLKPGERGGDEAE